MRLRLGSVEHELTTCTLVMGVLRGAPAASLDAVLVRAEQLVAEGADLLDLGAVTASGLGPAWPQGPGRAVGEEEETERLVLVVEAVRARFDIPLAVDTGRARVLAACCAAGAVVVGDGSAAAEAAYLQCAAQAGATVVLTHTRLRSPGGGRPGQVDVVGEVRTFLKKGTAEAEAAGIPSERIILDAGLDLGKTPAQSLTLLRETAALADLGPPLLLGAADKRFLGLLLELDMDERRVASHAATALGIARGCRIVRATDVRGSRRVADVLAALLDARLAQVDRAVAAAGDDGG